MLQKQKVPYRLVREIFWVLTLNFNLTHIVIELRWVVKGLVPKYDYWCTLNHLYFLINDSYPLDINY